MTTLVVATQSGSDLGAYLAVPAIVAGVRHGLVTTLNVTLVSGLTAAAALGRRPAQRLGPAARRDAAVARHRARRRTAGQLAVALHPRPRRPAGALRRCPPADGPHPPARELRRPGPRQRLAGHGPRRRHARGHGRRPLDRLRRRAGRHAPPAQRRARTSTGWPQEIGSSTTATAHPERPSCPLRGAQQMLGLLRRRRRAPLDRRARRARPGGGRRVRRPPRHRRPLRRRAHAGHLRGAQPDRPRDARRRGAGDRRARLHRRRDRVDQRPGADPRARVGAARRDHPPGLGDPLLHLRPAPRGHRRAPVAASLADYAREVSHATGLRVHLSLAESGPPLSPRTATEVLRVAQEAIGNVRKHAGAEQPVGHLRLRRRRRLSLRGRGRRRRQRRAARAPLGTPDDARARRGRRRPTRRHAPTRRRNRRQPAVTDDRTPTEGETAHGHHRATG